MPLLLCAGLLKKRKKAKTAADASGSSAATAPVAV
jgi:hypothetical protein